ncbi:MAG: acyl-CoA dehydrogenase family protein [Candidatus Binatia bacterium]|nr:acyl-CoA dehydrogenase family protein [Candidatus Binatia bacterium]
MYVDFTPDQKELRGRIREYFAGLMTDSTRERLSQSVGGPFYKEIIRQIGKDGWLGVGWPQEWGGQGFTGIEQLIFLDEARRAGAPLPFVTLNTVGPSIMRHGTEEQKSQFLPLILGGEVHFAIGYSEPGAGTDLASLTTSAKRNGDEYVVNGTKMFTSGANDADYIWLAARTDTNAAKHRGISILITPTDQPGLKIAPIFTVGDGRTNMTYYDDVRVPVTNLVGDENAGWKLITTQLNYERIGLGVWGCIAQRLVDDTIDFARSTTTDDGRPLLAQGWVQTTLAEAYARTDAAKVMNWRMAWELESGKLEPARASSVKVFGTEELIEIYRLLLDVLGAPGLLKSGSPGAVLRGEIEMQYRACQINTFGGGVNEIQRQIVAWMGLGLPRS